MSTLSQIREDVVEALTRAGVKATDYVQSPITPPIAIVIPADPYITEGDRFGESNINLQVLIIAPRGTSKASADFIDQQIESVLVALDDWDVKEVSQPGEVSVNGGNIHLAAVVSLTTETKF